MQTIFNKLVLQVRRHLAVTEHGCWVYTKKLNHDGYARPNFAWGLEMLHRYAYRTKHGDIPPGLEIDHRCYNRACCNPDHLDLVTRAENNRRGRSYWAARTHCKHGHEYTPENTRQGTCKSGKFRECITCARAKVAKYAVKKRAEGK